MSDMGPLMRLDRWTEAWAKRFFAFTETEPVWHGRVENWKWRLVLAYRALRGFELGGFR